MGRRPGRPLATLLAAGAVSSLGDGVTLAAAPLLAASVTRDPRAIAAVGVAWSLPWLLFALVSGAVADRADRRRLMVAADLVRVVSLAVLTAAVLGGRASIPALVALFFVNAAAETVFDTAWQSTLPMVVERDDLPRANGWLQTIEFAGNGLLGPALGGVLFAAAAAAPFAVDAASFGVSALLLVTLPGRFRAAGPAAGPDGPDRRPTLRADIAEGVRWLLGHRVLRTICWVLAIENIVEMAGFAMLVLLAQDVLGLDARGYGLLLACLAVGGVAGGTVAARLHRRLGDQGSVVGSTLLMSAAWALLAATGLPVVAGAGVALYGLAAVWWNVVTVSFRQAVVPERLQGRVNSAYRLVSWGTLSAGAAAGGVVVAQLGLRALYTAAAVVLLALAALAWRLLDAGSFAAARSAAGPSPEVGPA
jgi:predicted MFS family arabinose efflux permease